MKHHKRTNKKLDVILTRKKTISSQAQRSLLTNQMTNMSKKSFANIHKPLGTIHFRNRKGQDPAVSEHHIFWKQKATPQNWPNDRHKWRPQWCSCQQFACAIFNQNILRKHFFQMECTNPKNPKIQWYHKLIFTRVFSIESELLLFKQIFEMCLNKPLNSMWFYYFHCAWSQSCSTGPGEFLGQIFLSCCSHFHQKQFEPEWLEFFKAMVMGSLSGDVFCLSCFKGSLLHSVYHTWKIVQKWTLPWCAQIIFLMASKLLGCSFETKSLRSLHWTEFWMDPKRHGKLQKYKNKIHTPHYKWMKPNFDTNAYCWLYILIS